MLKLPIALGDPNNSNKTIFSNGRRFSDPKCLSFYCFYLYCVICKFRAKIKIIKL